MAKRTPHLSSTRTVTPYNHYREQWPDRTTTDHRELGRGVREDPSLKWLWLLGIVVLILILA